MFTNLVLVNYKTKINRMFYLISHLWQYFFNKNIRLQLFLQIQLNILIFHIKLVIYGTN